MSALSCDLYAVIGVVLRVFWLALLLYALVSWVPSLQGRWSSYLSRVVEPVLQPVRRVIPPVGGLDLSFLAVIFVVGWLPGVFARMAYSQGCGVLR